MKYFHFMKLDIAMLIIGLLSTSHVSAAEWKVEPQINFNVIYNDNVRLNTDELAQSSVGSTLAPSVKMKVEESSLWDMSLDAKGRLTRYKSADNADSNNVFLFFDSNRRTERLTWRLNGQYSENTNFDTNFDSDEDDGITSDRTDRTTVVVAPSVVWQMSETSQINVGLRFTDVSYDEVTSSNLKDYKYNTLNLSGSWAIAQNHRLGLTGTYSDYDSPEKLNFSPPFSFNQIILQLDYTFTINPTSSLVLSFGERSIDSTTIIPGIPIEISNEDRGAVIDVSYKSQAEVSTQSLLMKKAVVPSSFGSAQEKNSITYQLSIRRTKRVTAALILSASETTTLKGGNPANDRKIFRFQPSLRYRINKNWNASVQYRYYNQNITRSNDDRISNAVYVTLSLNWPKLATTYQ